MSAASIHSISPQRLHWKISNPGEPMLLARASTCLIVPVGQRGHGASGARLGRWSGHVGWTNTSIPTRRWMGKHVLSIAQFGRHCGLRSRRGSGQPTAAQLIPQGTGMTRAPTKQPVRWSARALALRVFRFP